MNEKYKVEAFIDPNDVNARKQLDGVTVYSPDDIDKLLARTQITEIIITDNNVLRGKSKAVVDACLNNGVKLLKVPLVQDLINGEFTSKQFKKVIIEDLLGREPIVLDEDKIYDDIRGKVVLVTGAAGSIGSEIVMQLAKFQPKSIVAFDQAESPLYDLELLLGENHNFRNFEIVIGDITRRERVEFLYETFRPEIVFHAAAYKHVPMMENNPEEAVHTNVYGTKVIADVSVEYGVKKFVMVSTDKAVNPTNVMGASKRIAEIYIQTLNNKTDVAFITTRFGNVLGSNGSVIPRFRKQIEEGGPVTVTHPEVTRFFMTIPEACQLVLQAGTLGNGGEIFIFDMGKSVKIVDLAKKMIKLSGLEVGTDIDIQFTGLRPGEKLYEELLNDRENTVATSHDKIMVANVRLYDNSVFVQIEQLIALTTEHDNFKLVGTMKKIVPEFTSKNSIYEGLDKPQFRKS
jgi:FlaA1/EpsC-like NDP-sugar epimerase